MRKLKNYRKTFTFTTVSAIALLVANHASAQSQDSARVAENKYVGDEIIVTARKTQETLADVPLAITALSGKEIEAAAIRDLKDVAGQTPGLVFVPIIGEFLPTPQIRGIGQVDLFATEPNVAIFVDGIYQGAREGLNISQLAIGRIEVVKGPQSAMYGRNSFAGAINIITEAPKNSFGGNASVTLGQDGRREVRGTVSGPIVDDKLSGRISGAYNNFDGSYENQSGGPDLGGAEMLTFSGALDFTPSEKFSLNLRGYYSDDEIAPPAALPLLPNCEPNSRGVNQTFCGTLPDIDTDDLSSHPDAYGQRRESWRWSLNGEYGFDSGWSITSLTGLNNVSIDAVTDTSRGQGVSYLYNTNPFVFPPAVSVFNAELLRFDAKVEVDEFSQEVRLSSPVDKSVRGSIGLFYYDFKRVAPQPVIRAITPLPADFQSFMPPFAGDAIYGGFFNGMATGNIRTTDVTDKSVFGHLEADVTDKVTLRGEIRYSDEKQSLNLNPGGSGTDTFKTWTGRVTADYSPDADTLFYASAGRGAKAGGFDPDDLSSPFGPEKITSYDIGLKRTFQNGRGMFDVAAFFNDQTDIQTPILDLALAPPTAVTTNQGDAESYGLEAEMRYAMTEELQLRLGAAWTKSKITSAISSGYSQYSQFAPNGDISGQPAGRSPEWQLNGSLDYQADINENWGWFWRVDANYQGKQFTNPSTTTIVPDRTIVNLRVGIDRDPWRLELFVENAFDEAGPVSAFNDVYFGTMDTGSFAIFPWRTTVTYARRQLLGGRLSVDF